MCLRLPPARLPSGVASCVRRSQQSCTAKLASVKGGGRRGLHATWPIWKKARTRVRGLICLTTRAARRDLFFVLLQLRGWTTTASCTSVPGLSRASARSTDGADGFHRKRTETGPGFGVGRGAARRSAAAALSPPRRRRRPPLARSVTRRWVSTAVEARLGKERLSTTGCSAALPSAPSSSPGPAAATVSSSAPASRAAPPSS